MEIKCFGAVFLGLQLARTERALVCLESLKLGFKEGGDCLLNMASRHGRPR